MSGKLLRLLNKDKINIRLEDGRTISIDVTVTNSKPTVLINADKSISIDHIKAVKSEDNLDDRIRNPR